ncbi:endosomal transmembrane epsin interactor 1 isoform X2 [Genypterus blacodes]|uniref:endosomal transmembrane epsin interactor 1 isoform X2 n=1 Tax=Genypterus blacodes TaxID=154954 RepID=UPI003F7631CD
MSLPVVLPGSCCPVSGASQLAEPSYRSRPRGLSSSRIASGGSRLLPGRPLLSLGLLQLLLGGSMVALSFGALSLSNSPPIRNSCPFWAGSSVILSGIVGLTTWRKPMLLLVNVFVLLSVVCVLLNLAGFILCCQGAQLVSSMTNCQLNEVGDMCYCCSLTPSSKCPEEKLLQLHPAHSCSTMRILLKKVLFALCALNALTTAVCLMAAALRYLQIFTIRTPCMDEPRAMVEEVEETQAPDPDEFVAPAPPPSYFSTFYSYTPRLARRILGDSVIPLPHIYGARIKGVEVFCPLEPPPPYEAVAGSSNIDTQETEIPMTELSCSQSPPGAPEAATSLQGIVDQAPPQAAGRRQRIHRSSSDPVLMDIAAKVLSSDTALAPSPQTTDSSTQTSHPTLSAHIQGQVTLRRGNPGTRLPCRPRPSSMVDYQSYRHTQQLVKKILEQPAAQGLAPEVQELVDSIRNVLQSDQEHMEEAVRCASYIEQVFTESDPGSSQCAPPQQQQPEGSSQTFPRRPRRRPGLLHLQSCGDLSSFTCSALESPQHPGSSLRVGSRTGSRLDHLERPHSLIGVFRETVL